MNKTAIKNYAIWARVELLEAVKQKAYEYGVTQAGADDAVTGTVGGRPLSDAEKEERRELIRQIAANGYDQTMEAAAYTWFNRFIALRYMEVNGYLPGRVRVFTNEAGEFKPNILNEAMTLELPGLEPDRVMELLERQDNETLYKLLLIAQCNALSDSLPRMFERIANWTELLFPGNLLKADSVLGRMVVEIPEDDWTDQVQIIGWLYQYYISEKHNEIVNIYKGTIKKEDIPAATQLFTTDWVVRYMVDNSLGRYWIERHPESTLGETLKYLARPKSDELAYIHESVTPQELTFFDPCMGSGHILVYAFEVLMEIYKECGYSERDATGEIVKNNLFGLDIDDRCSQLAYFAVMMKARSYDRRFLTRGIAPHVMSIQESNGLDNAVKERFMTDTRQNQIGEYLVALFRDAKEIGSLKNAKTDDYDGYVSYLKKCEQMALQDTAFADWNTQKRPLLEQLALQADILSRKYAVVCTNPPYMNKLEGTLKTFVTKAYKEYSGDLFSVFIFHNFSFCKEKGYSGFMTPFVWMFIKTYENLRNYILSQKALTTLIQMEYSAFEEATVPICSFVLQNCKSNNKSLCFRLADFKGGMEVQKEKVLQAIADPNCGYFYEADQANFSKIPGSPVAYWVGENFSNNYENKNIGDYAEIITGMTIGDNNKYLRLWFEVVNKSINIGKRTMDEINIDKNKWIPYSKGGPRRNWYGNYDYVVNWSQKNSFNRSKTTLQHLYLLEAITWPFITSGDFSARYLPCGFLWDVAGSPCFFKNEGELKYTLAMMASNVANYILKVVNPTINVQAIDISQLPLVVDENQKPKVVSLTENCIETSKEDWDSYETSWDFKRNPLV